jgi:hypothetical protein
LHSLHAKITISRIALSYPQEPASSNQPLLMRKESFFFCACSTSEA